MATDRQILVAGTASAPAFYEVPGSQEIEPLVVNATFDGSAATSGFLPTIEVISDGGIVIARVPALTEVQAGGSAEVTFAPALSGSLSPNLTYATQAIATAANGNTQLVAAVAGHRIRVKRVALMAAGNVGVKFRDGASDLTGVYTLIASTGFVLGPETQEWWFQTAVSSALNINLDAATLIGGVLGFEVV